MIVPFSSSARFQTSSTAAGLSTSRKLPFTGSRGRGGLPTLSLLTTVFNSNGVIAPQQILLRRLGATLRPLVKTYRNSRPGPPALPRLEKIAAFRVPNSLGHVDRKSTRLNSSHANISYAVF